MDSIILNLKKKIDKMHQDFDLIKDKIKKLEVNDIDKIYNLNNDLDKTIESLLKLKTHIFKNNLEILNYNHQIDIKDHLINEKINSIIKPLMLCLYLKFN